MCLSYTNFKDLGSGVIILLLAPFCRNRFLVPLKFVSERAIYLQCRRVRTCVEPGASRTSTANRGAKTSWGYDAECLLFSVAGSECRKIIVFQFLILVLKYIAFRNSAFAILLHLYTI